ncbi:unnamed protein product [Alternaria alternata]
MSVTPHSPFLALPRELRDEILGYLILPQYVYTSTSTKDTQNLYKSRQSAIDTYLDTRIYLPSRPPANILATCRQLREECLEHRLDPTISLNDSGTEFAEEAERACDDGTPRITLEIQRQLRGAHGYYIPTRDEVSPRFLALLPIMERNKKLRLILWPGYDWWNGGPPVFIDKRGNARINPGEAAKPNAASVAISRMLQHFPHVEELSVDVLIQASDGGRWDLPDKKWENIQSWLDAPIMPNMERTMKKVTRKLTAFWLASDPESFYVQQEIRQSGNTWKVDRKGDMGTPTMVSFLDTVIDGDMDFLRSLVVEESFVRTD